MATVTSTNNNLLPKPKGVARAGSAPPVRGYERPVPHPSSSSPRNSSNNKAAIHSQRPPKNPATRTSNIPSIAQAKRRRVPSASSSTITATSNDYYYYRSSLSKQCSVAMSRTESVMVSSAGDVIVCRCRRSSTPFIPKTSREGVVNRHQQFPCCDTDLLGSIEGPWSPVLQNLATSRNARKAISSGKTTASEDFSMYTWEKITSKTDNQKFVLGKTGTAVSSVNKSSISQRQEEALQQEQDEKIRPSSSRDDHGSPNSSNEKRKTNGEEEKKSPDGDRQEDDSSSQGSSVWENTISDLILSLPSFDYSHFMDGHNDMVSPDEARKQRKVPSPTSTKASRRKQQQQAAFPTIVESLEEKKEMDTTDIQPPAYEPEDKFFHGVPLFLSSLSQVKISKVSAHPLGAHVLMISEEALLFTYGLNNHGQLGIGFKSDIRNVSRGFHTTPTLITPLLENGGKTIDCAAGIDHSLVVVATEGRRLQKLQTKPGVTYSDHGVDNLRVPESPCEPSIDGTPQPQQEPVDERFHFSEQSVQYHQVYGFGRNNFMKLGLVHPSIIGDGKGEHAEDEVLPRRVALHCTVWPEEDLDDSLPPQGIFSIAASAEHSGALIRKATGDVEVSMWGNASLGALGLPLNLDPKGIKGEIARKPSFKKMNVSPLPTTVESLSHRRNGNPSSPYPTQMSLGPYCSFVVMSDGKCLSCGFSAEGMLGQAFNKTHTMEPHAVFLPSEKKAPSASRIVSVSAGAFHVIAVSHDGNVYSWGINSNDRLGLGTIDYTDLAHTMPKEKKEDLVVIEWVPQKVDVTHKLSKATKRTTSTNNKSGSADGNSDENDNADPNNRIALACAGYDSSMLVTESGQVLSFGKRSGRLGRGEISSNVNTPQPLYGGLHLFHAKRHDTMTKAPRGPRPKLERRASSSVLE